MAQAKSLFKQHLLGLLRDQKWSQLTQWVEQSRYYFYDDPDILMISAEMEWHQGAYTKALNHFLSAYGESHNPEQQRHLLQRSEQLIQTQVDAKNPQQISLNPHSPTLALLNIALEKQPQHAPFNLMMAEVLEAAGDLEGALYQLDLVPYSDQYQNQIDTMKAQLVTTLNQLEQQTQGIALTRKGEHFVAEVWFNEAVPLRLLIDTGASITALSKTAINQLKNYAGVGASDKSVQVGTANGTVTSKLYQVNSMRINEWSEPNVRVLEVPLPPNADIDGLLGMNFLSRYVFSIDQNQSKLFLQPRN